MERRDDKRRVRRVAVRFWKKGEEKARTGFTTNISSGGMFIGSNMVHGRGTRLRIEVLDPNSSFMVEGVVARAIRTQPNMQRLRASGMGIRFLKVKELVSELFPPTESRTPDGPPLRPRSVEPPPLSPPVGDEAKTAPPSEPRPTGYAYTVQYRSPAELKTAFERDIAQGGLFITTPAPAPLQKVVSIEISVFGVFLPAVRVLARVVHRTEPGAGDNANLLAGMGLELLDPEQAKEALRPLVEHSAGPAH